MSTRAGAPVPAARAPGSDVQRERIVAVSAYDDPIAAAHRLRQLHEQWRAQTTVPPQVRAVIARAWERQTAGPAASSCDIAPTRITSSCAATGAYPAATPANGAEATPVGAEEIEARRERSGLAAVLPLLRQTLLEVAAEAGNELVVCDAEGVVVWVDGPGAVLRASERLGFVEGARWSESSVGTNGLGTALIDGRPIQIFGPEHSREDQHGWVCTGAPLMDPGTARPLGAITLAGPLRTAHPNTLALVAGAASMARAVLESRQAAGLQRLRGRAHEAAPSSGAWMVVDDLGWVAAHRDLPGVERVRVPGGLRSGPVWSPALGALIAEPFADGWLLRPGDDSTRLVLRPGPVPVVRVDHGGSFADIALSTRHAAILAALAAHPAGMSGDQLIAAAYEAPVTSVTVRAEVSRLRRQIGPYVQARPYRLTVPCMVQ